MQDKRGEPPVVWYAAYPGSSCDLGSVNVHECQVERASRLCDDEERADDRRQGQCTGECNSCRRPNGWALTDIVGEGGGPPGVRTVCARPVFDTGAPSCRSWNITLNGATVSLKAPKRAAPRGIQPTPSVVGPDVVVGGDHAPLAIWRNPSTTKTGEAGALYLNLSSNMAPTPAAGGLVAQTTRVTNDAARDRSLWGHDIVVQMGGRTPFDARDGITLRALEAELGNVAEGEAFETDPFHARPGRVRSNAVEAVGIGGYPAGTRNTAGFTTWANSTDGGQWWHTGIALSSVARVGLKFVRNPGGRLDQVRAFERAAIEDASNSGAVLLVGGGHESIVDLSEGPGYRQFVRGAADGPTNLNVRNDANEQVNFLLDSGHDKGQISYFAFADRGALKWSFLKDAANGFHFFQHSTGRSAIRVRDGYPTVVELDGVVIIGGYELYAEGGALKAKSPDGRVTVVARH